MIPALDRRWTRGAWLTLAAAAGLLLTPVVATIAGRHYPTDGWTSVRLDTGAYRLEEPISAAPSRLRAGDVIIAIEGQALRPGQLPPLPPALHPGQVLRYDLERAGQRLAVEVTLGQRTLADLGRFAGRSVAAAGNDRVAERVRESPPRDRRVCRRCGAHGAATA